MINSTIRRPILGLTRTFNAAKILLSIVSISSFEPLSNRFRLRANRVAYTKNDFLHFTNISLFYTILCVCVGFARNWSPVLEQLHRFLLPTSIVLEMMVTLLFWSLFLVNPTLVKRTSMGNDRVVFSCSEEVPKHLLPLIIILMEQNGMDLHSAWAHRIFLVLFSAVYFAMAETLIVYENNHLYPFLKRLTIKGRVLFFLFTMAMSIVLYEAWMRLKRLAKYISGQAADAKAGRLSWIAGGASDSSQNLQFESGTTVSHEKAEVSRAEAAKESKLSGVEENQHNQRAAGDL